MHLYLIPLKELLDQQANPKAARPMKKYMRDRFEFLGLKSPQRRELLKSFVAEYGLPPLEELDEIMRQLWAWPEREFQYTAMDLLDRRQRKLTPEHVGLLEYLIVTKSWWDTVDLLASHGVGGLFARYPEIRDEHIGRWRISDDFWLRRTTLLFQLPYKGHTDEELLYALIQENLDSKEFFIQKAIGWALREYSKTNATSVQGFVAETDLAPLSEREALKWLKR
jgi:3-methyladenine DNA glycosylase AlkD